MTLGRLTSLLTFYIKLVTSKEQLYFNNEKATAGSVHKPNLIQTRCMLIHEKKKKRWMFPKLRIRFQTHSLTEMLFPYFVKIKWIYVDNFVLEESYLSHHIRK